MRAERIVDEVAAELAKEEGKEWAALSFEDKEAFRRQAREKAALIRERLGDRRRKYRE
jgi:HMG-box domain